MTKQIIVQADTFGEAWTKQNENNTELYLPVENTIVVALSGGDYTSIKDALDSITDNAVDNRYVIRVGPGGYEEDNPIQGKEYVVVKAIGDSSTTQIVASNVSSDLITMANFFLLEGLTFAGVTGASNYAINQTVAGITGLLRCVIADCSNGIHVNNVGASMTITEMASFNTTASTIKGLCLEAGTVSLSAYSAPLGTIGTLVEATGPNSRLRIDALTSSISTITTGIYIDDSADVVLNNTDLSNMYDGIVCQNGAVIKATSSYIDNAQNDAFRVNDSGVGVEVTVKGFTALNSGRYDLNVEADNASISGSGRTSIDQFHNTPGSVFYGIITDLKEGDEGTNILGELHVGLPEHGSESVFGEGDSYTRGMLVYTEDASNNFDNVSDAARSASSSSFTFTGVTAENSIYMASSLASLDVLEHYGVKINTLTACVVGSGEIVIEYWNGSAWAEVNGMEVDSSNSYFPYAKRYFQHIGGHHIRYDANLAVDSWTKNDPISLGTDYYWVRFRIKTAITTAPVFEQCKLHTNRFEINTDGWLEYFGRARPVSKLAWDFGVLEKAGADADDRDVYLGDFLDVGMKKNRFANAKLSRVGFNIVLPLDCDTSSPITFSWSIISEGGGGTDVDWTLRWGSSSDGDSVYPSAPGSSPASQQEYSASLAAPILANTVKWYTTTLDISDMVSRREDGFPDTIWFTIQRDGISDAHGSDIDFVTISANYMKWCEGGHI